MKLADVGANLTACEYVGSYYDRPVHEADLDAVLERAGAVGVDTIICTAGSVEETEAALEIVEKHSTSALALYTTLGVHPTRCQTFEEKGAGGAAALEELKEVGRRHAGREIRAIGEFGLDYDRTNFCDKQTQEKYFELQFELVDEFRLPLFLHNRNTGGDFVDLVSRNRDRFQDGVSHSFTGSKQELDALLDLDLYIGINGCSLKTQENVELAAAIPSEKLLIETDAPYCEIRPSHAGHKHVKTKLSTKKKEKFEYGTAVKGRNEPANLIQVLEVLAAVREEDEFELSEQIYDNTKKIFSI